MPLWNHNNLFRLVIGMLLSSFLSACQTQLERPVPIWAGISLQEDCSAQQVWQDIGVFDEFALQGWLIEIPFFLNPEGESSSVRYYERHALDTLVEYVSERKLPYGISFGLSNPRSYTASQINLAHYFTDLTGILLRLKEFPPQRLVFREAWLDSALMGNRLQIYLRNLKEVLPWFKGEIVFSLFPYQLEQLQDWESPDVIGIEYHEVPQGDFRVYFMKTQRRICELLSLHDKAAWITQSNLLGEQKLDMFRHQLRFWDPDISLLGLVLNSQSCQLSLADKQGPFGLQQARALQSFLHSYSQSP